MKLSLLLTLLLMPCLAMAQTNSADTTPPPPADVPPPPHVPPDPDQQLKHMTDTLKLTQGQQDKIKPILVDAAQKRQAIMDNTSLSDADKHTQMMALHLATKTAIENELTEVQTTEFEQMHQHHPSGSGGTPPATPPAQ